MNRPYKLVKINGSGGTTYHLVNPHGNVVQTFTNLAAAKAALAKKAHN